LVTALLFGLAATDALSLVAATLVMLTVSSLAAYLPRAARREWIRWCAALRIVRMSDPTPPALPSELFALRQDRRTLAQGIGCGGRRRDDRRRAARRRRRRMVRSLPAHVDDKSCSSLRADAVS
jgi:hypothetical protein